MPEEPTAGRPAYLTAAELAEVDAELRRAGDAIAAGNDGRARVCARRACGAALRAWRRASGLPAGPADATTLLRAAASDPELGAAVRDAARRLSAPVSGDPAGVSSDPIGDARLLIAGLAPPAGSAGPGSGGTPAPADGPATT